MSYYIVGPSFGQDETGKTSCEMFCYDNKSKDYTDCRELPVGQERNECFELADQNLKNCLTTKCGSTTVAATKSASGTMVVAAAAIAAAALLLS